MNYVAQLEAKIGTGWGISMIDRALESCFTQYIFMISPVAQLWSNISTNYPGGGGILNPCYSCTNLNIDVNFLWHTWPQLLIALCYFCDGIFIMSSFIMKEKHGHCFFLVFSWSFLYGESLEWSPYPILDKKRFQIKTISEKKRFEIISEIGYETSYPYVRMRI